MVSYTIPRNLSNLLGSDLKQYQNGYLLFNRVLEDKTGANFLKPWKHINSIQKAAIDACSEFKPAEEQESVLSNNATMILSRKRDFVLNGRMIIGLGIQSVSEVSMTLHHTYGIPYIPAQAVKGLVRSFIIQEIFNGEETEAEKSLVFQIIFGKTSDANEDGKQGKIVFYDAYPCSRINLKMDVMTNHHQKYYTGEKLNDSENTNPVKFLTVENTSFRFLIGIKRKDLQTENALDMDNDIVSKSVIDRCKISSGESQLVEVCAFWLEKALQFGGIGAKSAEGYGYFDVEIT